MTVSFEYGATLVRKLLRSDSVIRSSLISLFTRLMISLASCMRLDFFTLYVLHDWFVGQMIFRLDAWNRSIFGAISDSCIAAKLRAVFHMPQHRETHCSRFELQFLFWSQ